MPKSGDSDRRRKRSTTAVPVEPVVQKLARGTREIADKAVRIVRGTREDVERPVALAAGSDAEIAPELAPELGPELGDDPPVAPLELTTDDDDTVVVDEIRFGDNDTLGALVTNLIEADALVILTDQKGLYSADPRKVPGAELVARGRAGDPALEAMAGGAGSHLGSGGMIAKVQHMVEVVEK